MYLVLVKRSLEELCGAVKTIEIIKELIEIGLNKVCDITIGS